MRSLPMIAAVLCLSATPLAAYTGGPEIEPGLWETTARSEMVGMPFRKTWSVPYY